MVAIAQSIRELVEIRKFAISLEEVLLVSYDKSKFPGNHITEAERKKHELPKKKKDYENDDLWELTVRQLKIKLDWISYVSIVN